MNENEAIERIKYRMHTAGQVAGENGMEDLEMAIKALEEIQKYHAIGTPEELRTMREYGGFSGIELAKIAAALTGLKEYQQLGTLEECRAAMEKQTAKKVKSISQVKDGDSYVGLIGRCPCCEDILEEGTVYCDCGQKLDWDTDTVADQEDTEARR